MPASSVPRLLLSLLSAIAAGCVGDQEFGQCDTEPLALFERRIKPLLETDRPESCARCHAAGVGLADFVRGSPCEAMACLKQDGLVDLDNPQLSVLLNWIGRVDPDSSLITPSIVEEERTAFLQWFEHEAACQTCAAATCPEQGPGRCDTADASGSGAYDRHSDPADCSRETLERLFRGTVYENRGRCTPCHFEGEPRVLEAPRFFTEVGTCQTSSLATLLRMEHRGYFQMEEPTQSLLLLKPLPEELGGVPHEGHDKFAGKADPAYRAFLYFIERRSNCEAERLLGASAPQSPRP